MPPRIGSGATRDPSKAQPPNVQPALWRRALDAAALPRWFVGLAIPLGLMFVFLMPPLQIPDEQAHFYRSYSVSTGRCIASAEEAMPAAMNEWPAIARPVQWSRLKRYFHVRWSDGAAVPVRNTN